jgi:hypothetical protein
LPDGLPLVPPTPEKIAAAAAARAGRCLPVPPRWGSLTREVLAINMVMAGCRPGCAPVEAAMLASEARFNLKACRRRRTWRARSWW